MPHPENVDEPDLDISQARGSQENSFVSVAEPGELKPGVGSVGAGDHSPCQVSEVAQEVVLSFFARDLLARLVRPTATVRRDPTNPGATMWFHNDGYLEVTLQVATVDELLRSGLIECENEEIFRVSAAGKKIARLAARTEAVRSATTY